MIKVLHTDNLIIQKIKKLAAALHEQFGFLWTGYYLVSGEDELVLGPFQGPVACTCIKKGRGVCGTCWAKDQSIVVQDVEKFPDHIPCLSKSRSQICLPLRDGKGRFLGLLDIDSREVGCFDQVDAAKLQSLHGWLAKQSWL